MILHNIYFLLINTTLFFFLTKKMKRIREESLQNELLFPIQQELFLPLDVLEIIFKNYMFSGLSIAHQYGKEGFKYDYNTGFIDDSLSF
jgi:hypothetical protein